MGQRRTVTLLCIAAIVSVLASLWLACLKYNGHHAAVQVQQQQLGHPVSGLVLRQGRRFAMEDRADVVEGQLPGGGICGALNYTYAAIYDGHEGSAVCDMLQQQLHPLISAAAAASRLSNCAIHTESFKVTVTAAAHQLNDAFLQRATHAQQFLQAQQAITSSSSAQHDSSLSNSSSDQSSTHGPGSATNSSSVSGDPAESVNLVPSAASAAAGWDGDDGSTAVFAMLVGRQLLVGNVGNSRAILCASRPGNSSRAGRGPQEHSSDALAGITSSISPRHGVVQQQGAAAGDAHYSKAVTTAAVAVCDAAEVAAGAIPDADASNSSRSKTAVQHQQHHSAIDMKQVHVSTGFSEAVGHPVQPCSSSCRSNEHYSRRCRISSSRYGSHGASRPLRPVDAPSKPLKPIPLSYEHTPARDDEAARIRAAGGQVFVNPSTPNGKPRVRGELEVTRSFGDLGFQDQGVVATPEFKSHDLHPGDAFVVLASDGVFEVLTQEDVCQHAWGVWSGSSNVATAVPPPPALAISGQVAAASAQQRQLEAGTDSSSSSSIANSVAALRGCCDCTVQQQIQQAAEAAEADLQVLLRQRRAVRKRHSKVSLEEQLADQDATAAAAAAAGEGGTFGCAASAASNTSGDVNQAASSAQEPGFDRQVTPIVMHGDGQQQQWGADSTCMVTQPSGAIEHCQMQNREDYTGGTECDFVNDEPDADFVAESSHADMTYGYCKNPTGIETPYTLPQAIALRIVSESYNRMSMDNLAVVVLDVRELAAASGEAVPVHEESRLSSCAPCLLGSIMSLWSARPWAVATWVRNVVGTLCRLVGATGYKAASASNQHSVDAVGDLARPSSVADLARPSSVADLARPSSVADLARPSSVADLARPSSVADLARPSSVADVARPSSVADLARSNSAADFQALATAASSINWEQPGDSGCVECYGKVPLVVPGSHVEALQLLDVHLPLCDIHHLLETPDGLFVTGTGMLPAVSDPRHPHSEPLARYSEDLDPAAMNSKLSQGQTAHVSGLSPVVEGGAIVCRRAPTAPQHAQTIDSTPEAAQHYQRPQETGVEPHSYLLVQRFAPAVSMAADHMHLHPMLGLEELQLEASMPPHQQPENRDHRVEHDGAQVLVSFARHMRPSRFVHQQLMIAGTAAELDSVQAAKDPATGEQLCSSLLVQHRQQQELPNSMPPAASSSTNSPWTSEDLAQSSSKTAQAVGSDAGFMSACLAGTAADPGVQVIQGGQGLSAVVEALAALPLHDSLNDTVDTMSSSTTSMQASPGSHTVIDRQSDFAPEHLHVENDGLVEPAWGRAQPDGPATQPAPADTSIGDKQPYTDHLPAVGAYTSVVPFFRAGLLLMAGSRPGRALLSWHPNLRHSMLQNDLVNARLAVRTVGSSKHAEESSLRAAGASQQTHHVLQARATSEVFDSLYKLGKQAGRGSFGEVWLATRLTADLTAQPGASHGHGPLSRGTNLHGRNNGKGGAEQRQHGESAAHRAESVPRDSNLVLKRVSGTSGDRIKYSALREAYFGQLLMKRQAELRSQQGQGHHSAASLLEGHDHLVRFVEAFTGSPDEDVWLVFQNEGKSLHSLMYEATQLTIEPAANKHGSANNQGVADTVDSPAGLSLVGPSRWWAEVRTSQKGHLFVASIMQQLLQALEAVHAANISHRDVKPENLLVTYQTTADSGASGSVGSGGQAQSGTLQPDPLSLHLRLIDFGSAVDVPSIVAGWYGRRQKVGGQDAGPNDDAQGPSMDELTLEYAPPEVLFSSRYHHPLSAGIDRLRAYDIWSAGVVMLELILGTPAVFTPSPITRAAVDKQLHLHGRSTEERQLLYLLRGLMELCIYPPRIKPNPTSSQRAGPHTRGSSPGGTAALPIPWSCCDDALLKLISSRDPQGVGFEGALGLRLLQRLLSWDPSQRPTSRQASDHAYFVAAEIMRQTGMTSQSEQYQRLVVECSRLAVGQPGWC